MRRGMLFSFLLVYVFCSPYNFRQFILDSSYYTERIDRLLSLIHPIAYILGLLVIGCVMAQWLSYRRTIIVVLLFNILFTFLAELAYLINSPKLFYISYYLQGFYAGGLRILIYEYVTEISYPYLPALFIAIFNAFTYSVILVITITSDDFVRNVDHTYKHRNVFNDLLQFTFIIYLCFATFYFSK